MGHHDVLDGDQGDEDYESHHVVAAHHERAEGFDDVAGGGNAFIAMQQNAPAGSQIQRQPEQRE